MLINKEFGLGIPGVLLIYRLFASCELKLFGHIYTSVIRLLLQCRHIDVDGCCVVLLCIRFTTGPCPDSRSIGQERCHRLGQQTSSTRLLGPSTFWNIAAQLRTTRGSWSLSSSITPMCFIIFLFQPCIRRSSVWAFLVCLFGPGLFLCFLFRQFQVRGHQLLQHLDFSEVSFILDFFHPFSPKSPKRCCPQSPLSRCRQSPVALTFDCTWYSTSIQQYSFLQINSQDLNKAIEGVFNIHGDGCTIYARL